MVMVAAEASFTFVTPSKPAVHNILDSRISEVTPPTEEVLEPLAGERRLLISFASIVVFMVVTLLFNYLPPELATIKIGTTRCNHQTFLRTSIHKTNDS